MTAMLPSRGDPRSRLVIGVALLYRNAFWLMAVWLPIAIGVGVPYLARGLHWDLPSTIGFAIGLTIGLLVDSVLWLLIARGIMSGNRLAYLVSAANMLGFAGLCLLVLLVGRSDQHSTVLFVSLIVTSTALAVALFAVALRRRFDNG